MIKAREVFQRISLARLRYYRNALFNCVALIEKGLFMELYDVMRTTFAVREFTDDPLPDDTLFTILDGMRRDLLGSVLATKVEEPRYIWVD